MKTLKKNLLVFVICILSAVSFVLGFSMKETVKLVSAQGQQVEEFFVYGASVRAPEGEIDAAVKFHILAEENFYNENIVGNDVNVKVIVARNLAENETVLTTQNTGKVLSFPITSAWTESELKEGYVEAVAYFYGIPNNCYDVDLAVAAEVVEGGEVAYYTNQRTASLAWVAWKSGSDAFNAYRPNYTVSFDGGETVTAMYGTSFDELNVADGVKEGYTFEGWDYDATTAITGNVNVKANWSVDYELSVDSTATVYNDKTNGAGIFDLGYTINPKLSASVQENVTYSYMSDNTSVATVQADGKVVGAGKGTATITVTATDRLTGEEQTQDVEVTVKNYYEIDSEAEFDAIANDADGYYRMTGDIAFTGTHKNDIDFTGTFDGNGKKMTGLVTAQRVTSGEIGGGGLFYKMSGATIKNLVVMDVQVGKDSSVLTGGTHAASTKNIIDNVYISVKSVVYASNGSGALVNRTFGDVEITNTVVYVYVPAGSSIGFVKARTGNGTATIKDSVFIGTGINDAYNLQAGTIVRDEKTTNCSAINAHDTVNLSKMSAQNKAAFEANHVLINNSNFKADTFKTLTTQVVELAEDIKAGDYTLGTAQPVFSGVFEGNGFTISGLIIKQSGLFYKLTGATIRNVVFKDATIGHVQGAVIAYQANDVESTIENVYVHVDAANDATSTYTCGVLINRTWKKVNVSNTVIVIDEDVGNDIGFLTGNKGGCNFSLTSCVLIGSDGISYGKDNDTKNLTKDEATDTYTHAQVNADVLEKMSDQNYKAYTGTAKA